MWLCYDVTEYNTTITYEYTKFDLAIIRTYEYVLVSTDERTAYVDFILLMGNWHRAHTGTFREILKVLTPVSYLRILIKMIRRRIDVNFAEIRNSSRRLTHTGSTDWIRPVAISESFQ